MDSKLNFPQVLSVQLAHFSLYNLQPNIELEFPRGVFCLAGANGLGKSTFLAALNFAITGLVPDPSRDFKSVKEYSDFGFSTSYFTGRIAEDDRDRAWIGVSLQVKDCRFYLRRGVFEPDELRELVITDAESGYTATFDDKGRDSSDGVRRQREYEAAITKTIGLDSFQQFIFLQHFVLTFDESRHLVLWDDKVLTQVLYVSIGADYAKAQLADKLRREIEKADSRARNRNYAASNVRSRIEDLRATIQGDADADLADLRVRHEELTDEVDRFVKEADRKRDQLNDAHLKLLEASAALSSLQADYAKEFSRRIHRRMRVDLHPLIVASLSENRCGVCGSSGQAVSGIQSRIDSGDCPLCGTGLPKTTAGESSLEALQAIDEDIEKCRKRLGSAQKAKERLEAEFQVARDLLAAKRAELSEFEATNEAFMSHIVDVGLAAAIANLQKEMEELLRQKREEYARRDEKHKEYMRLQRELQVRYMEAETEFVPLFQKLASLFLGIDLQVRLNSSSSPSAPGLSLELEMRGETRRETYQLSESQRFFLDIALRMALAQYMSSTSGPALLLIDTPEGSLDIAYESRAGDMFAEFAKSGHGIIMTANINSSQLLLSLAAQCGRKWMTLHRMTSWTELSEVQLSGEQLFSSAYSNIESALG